MLPRQLIETSLKQIRINESYREFFFYYKNDENTYNVYILVHK